MTKQTWGIERGRSRISRLEKEILVFKLISESSPNSAFVVAASFFASGFGFRVEAKWGLGGGWSVVGQDWKIDLKMTKTCMTMTLTILIARYLKYYALKHVFESYIDILLYIYYLPSV